MKSFLATLGGFFRGILNKLPSRTGRGVLAGAQHKAVASARVSVHPRSSSPPTAKRSSRRRRVRVRVRKKQRLIIIAAAVAVAVALAVVLPIVLTSEKPQVASAQHGLLPALPNETLPEAEPAAVTLAMPAYSTLSVSEGISADVVADLQERLMELGYMDDDEPDGIFGEGTRVAVEHFQEQHGLDATGTVDQQTLTLLLSAEAQEYTITIGTEDTDVAELQQRLYELGYISKTTGYFGTDTESAVKKFQKRNGLKEDGKVGKVTREQLYSDSAVANAFSYGEQSPEILSFQQRLKKLGYLTTEPDGSFGADTKAAVKRFQESSGLIADGYIGPATKTALMSDKAQGNALSIGAEGSDVERVQKRLKELGYLSKVTGYFGSDTETAVRSFQHTNRLSVDGKVGAQTMNKLTSSGAKKSTGTAITGANASSFVEVAKSKLGSKYVRGAKGPDRFDCSGFVFWCLNKVGVKQAYMTSGGWAASKKYTKINSIGDLKKGDVIVFKGHVGIIAGGGMMIDASSGNGKVVKRSYTSPWCKRMFICGFRIF